MEIMIGNFRLPYSISSNAKLDAYGNIFNKTIFTDSSDFTLFGDATSTVSGTGLLLTCATNGTFNQGMTLNKTTGLNQYKFKINFKIISATSAPSFGIGIGLKTQNSNASYHHLIRLDTQSTSGVLYIHYGVNYGTILATLTGCTIATNDVVELILEQSGAYINVIFFNVTSGLTKETGYIYFGVPGSEVMPNVGKPVINLFGGSFLMNSYQFYTKEVKFPKMICIGDSKTKGYYTHGLQNGWTHQLNNKYGDVLMNAGGFDETSHVLLKMQEIINFEPKKVLLNIGSNDKRQGRAYASWVSNYDNIVYQLITAGIDVYHLLQLNETVLSFTDYNNYITTTYPSSNIVNAGTITLNSDGIHPNQNGHNQIYSAIESQIGAQIT